MFIRRMLPLCLLPVSSLLFVPACSGDDEDEATPSPTQAPTATPVPTPEVWVIPEDYAVDPRWDNAIVYFVVTDRFYNGNPENDTSYGRVKGSGAGDFHGGDLAGLTQKLQEGYFGPEGLDIDALWITAPYEQIHGWVVGGTSAPYFQHYAYHGYYASDFTRLDANMGTGEELKALIDEAHARGIRVLFDVVMNHPGYAAIADLNEYGVDVLKDGWEDYTLEDYHSNIDYESENWVDWWGPEWIRAGFPGHEQGGADDLTQGVQYLPDFITESTEPVDLPVFYANKPDTAAVAMPDYTVRDYLVSWLTAWVREYGVDGFRCDTVKHVEKPGWKQLKVEAIDALRDWKAAHPGDAMDETDFWMTGEVWGHNVYRDDYFDYGFNNLINFELQAQLDSSKLSNPALIESAYAGYASTLAAGPQPFGVLSYLSSHDTKLYFSDVAKGDTAKMKTAAALLMLAPGAVQIFYGDENGRTNGTFEVAGDAQQKTRSDMPWPGDEELLAHWRILTQFRRHHLAVGTGAHTRLADSPYTFSRATADDKVVAVIGAPGSQAVSIPVGSAFSDGDNLKDAYTGQTAKVSSGKVTITAGSAGVILLEEAP